MSKETIKDAFQTPEWDLKQLRRKVMEERASEMDPEAYAAWQELCHEYQRRIRSLIRG